MKAIAKYLSIQAIADKLYSADTQNTAETVGIALFTLPLGGRNCKRIIMTTILFHKDKNDGCTVKHLETAANGSYVHFRGFSVILQIDQWMNVYAEVFDPWLRGWHHGSSGIEQVTSDIDVAPENVLKGIRWMCKLPTNVVRTCVLISNLESRV